MDMKYLVKRLRSLKFSTQTQEKLESVSEKTLKKLESGTLDLKLSTLKRILTELGYQEGIIDQKLARLFKLPINSIEVISELILLIGEEHWRICLFNFVDAFRSCSSNAYVVSPPVLGLSMRMEVLIASTVEALCEELGMTVPNWCSAVPPLERPWFVSDIEDLKAIALIECPTPFRKRNIFVHKNFLSRA